MTTLATKIITTITSFPQNKRMGTHKSPYPIIVVGFVVINSIIIVVIVVVR